jgi:glycosyltransferase involved in cell wall biosynthesis
MAERPILFDLTEFLNDPQRSGIQRVSYEIVDRWPAPDQLVPCCVDRRGRLVALPTEVLEVYRLYFRAPPEQLPVLRDRLKSMSRRRIEIITARRFGRFAALLNTTIFTQPSQIDYYVWAARHGLAARIFLVVYDMLPWTHPEFFVADFGVNLLGYHRCLRAIPNLAYISAQTRDDALRRVLRDGRPPGPVLPLGSDGLGTAAPRFDAAKRRFTVVGTLEPRKNHRAVLDAFEGLWAEGIDAELAFAGRLGWLPEADAQRIRRLQAEQPRFHWWNSLGDDEVAEVIRGSRATIYPAICEGYGLPPVESLALGVPVIVTESLPSAAMLPPDGQVRLAIPNAEQIREAVLAMLDGDFARRTTEAIGRLRLPTWSDLAKGVAHWIESTRAANAVSFALAG